MENFSEGKSSYIPSKSILWLEVARLRYALCGILEIHACMQQPLALLIKNATIFWEHEVFVDCCHSNTAIYIFSVFFFKTV